MGTSPLSQLLKEGCAQRPKTGWKEAWPQVRRDSWQRFSVLQRGLAVCPGRSLLVRLSVMGTDIFRLEENTRSRRNFMKMTTKVSIH